MTAILERPQRVCAAPPPPSPDAVHALCAASRGWRPVCDPPLFFPGRTVEPEPIFVGPWPDGPPAVFNLAGHAAQVRLAATELGAPSPPDGLLAELIERLLGQRPDPVGAQGVHLRPSLAATATGFVLRLERSAVISEQLATPFTPRTLRIRGRAQAPVDCAAGDWTGQAWLSADHERTVRLPPGVHVFFRYPDGLRTLPDEARHPTVTSAAIRALAADLGLPVGYEPMPIERLWADCAEMTIIEAFVSGVAPSIVPVGSVRVGDHRWTVRRGQPGQLTIQLSRRLSAIRSGLAKDQHRWMHRLGNTRSAFPERSRP